MADTIAFLGGGIQNSHRWCDGFSPVGHDTGIARERLGLETLVGGRLCHVVCMVSSGETDFFHAVAQERQTDSRVGGEFLPSSGHELLHVGNAGDFHGRRYRRRALSGVQNRCAQISPRSGTLPGARSLLAASRQKTVAFRVGQMGPHVWARRGRWAALWGSASQVSR